MYYLRNSLQPEHHAVDLFPDHLYFPKLPDTLDAIDDFARRFLLPSVQPSDRFHELRNNDNENIPPDGDEQSEKPPVSQLKAARERETPYRVRESPTIYICGHMARDSRCGILGPILRDEFSRQIKLKLQSAVHTDFPGPSTGRGIETLPRSPWQDINIGLCSHIGGHAFAGNVIIYFPSTFRLGESGEISPLAGQGVWYGRVQPKHVEGILETTIRGGKVIQELCRGVHQPEVS
ncbi:Altered inheritance of mitochondria protein 32 [Lecanora helva]